MGREQRNWFDYFWEGIGRGVGEICERERLKIEREEARERLIEEKEEELNRLRGYIPSPKTQKGILVYHKNGVEQFYAIGDLYTSLYSLPCLKDQVVSIRGNRGLVSLDMNDVVSVTVGRR